MLTIPPLTACANSASRAWPGLSRNNGAMGNTYFLHGPLNLFSGPCSRGGSRSAPIGKLLQQRLHVMKMLACLWQEAYFGADPHR